MNIYQKLIKARIDLQNLNLKKTGKNTYSNYDYFELGDFLPAINEICGKYELLTGLNIIHDGKSEKAVLTIYNATEPTERVKFVAPTAEAKIGVKKDGTGGADPIQNLGGKITYMRRYMLVTAFEMVESDIVEQIKRDLADELPESEIEKITKAKDKTELLKVCGSLKKKYKYSLITPHYEKRLVELTQDEVEDQTKGKK
jgi:hypothetical protein